MSIFVVLNPNSITTVLKEFGILKLHILNKNRLMSSTIAFLNFFLAKQTQKSILNACALSLKTQMSLFLFFEYTLTSNPVTTVLKQFKILKSHILNKNRLTNSTIAFLNFFLR